ALRLKPCKHLLAALCHRGAVAFFIPTDVGLDALDLFLLTLRDDARRIVSTLSLGAVAGVIALRECLDASLAQLEHALYDRIEEVPIVTDNQHRRATGLHVILQPLCGGKVQMIRRL